jgi:hypothetical protein
VWQYAAVCGSVRRCAGDSAAVRVCQCDSVRQCGSAWQCMAVRAAVGVAVCGS